MEDSSAKPTEHRRTKLTSTPEQLRAQNKTSCKNCQPERSRMGLLKLCLDTKEIKVKGIGVSIDVY